MMKYAVVIEDAGTNFSAYVPDLPGCVATGRSIKEAETEIRSAIQFHLQQHGGYQAQQELRGFGTALLQPPDPSSRPGIDAVVPLRRSRGTGSPSLGPISHCR
jgi:predicted RNase H-like HicB family nuclease